MAIFLTLALLAAQPPQPVSTRDLAIPPGQTPADVSPVPISEVAEPLGLAIAAFDADQDGRTSRAELDSGATRSFDAADTDHDGALGYIEYSGWATTWLGSQSALPGPFAIDVDGDNRITRAEFAAELARQFARLDADHDGAISHAELLTVRNPRMAPVLDRNGRPIRRPRRDDR